MAVCKAKIVCYAVRKGGVTLIIYTCIYLFSLFIVTLTLLHLSLMAVMGEAHFLSEKPQEQQKTNIL